jgi:hypothetical protein
MITPQILEMGAECRVDQLTECLNQNSTNSSRPPSSEPPTSNADHRRLLAQAFLEVHLGGLALTEACD